MISSILIIYLFLFYFSFLQQKQIGQSTQKKSFILFISLFVSFFHA